MIERKDVGRLLVRFPNPLEAQVSWGIQPDDFGAAPSFVLLAATLAARTVSISEIDSCIFSFSVYLCKLNQFPVVSDAIAY